MNNNIKLPRKRSHTHVNKYSFSMLSNKLFLVKQGRKRLSICTNMGTYTDRERERGRERFKKGDRKRFPKKMTKKGLSSVSSRKSLCFIDI